LEAGPGARPDDAPVNGADRPRSADRASAPCDHLPAVGRNRWRGFNRHTHDSSPEGRRNCVARAVGSHAIGVPAVHPSRGHASLL